MQRMLSISCLLILSFATIVRADDAEQVQIIRKHLQAGETSAAEEVFQKSIEEFPDSAQLHALHYMLYYYNNRDGNHAAAIDHLEAHLTHNVLPTDKLPAGNLASLMTYVNRLVEAYQAADRQKEGGEKLDELLAKLESLTETDKDNAFGQIAVRELRNRKIQFQAENGQPDEAQTMLTTHLSAAEKALADQPDDALALLDVVFLLKGAGQLAAATDSDDAQQKQQQFLDRVLAAAGEHPDNVPLVIAAVNENVSAIAGIARKEPFQAEEQLEKLKKFGASIESEDALIKGRIEYIDRAAASLQRSIEAGKVHAELIGKDAFPLDAVAWVNGELLTDSDLKGKVVLLDFWAVWCGPCIATFPHLREWQEQYQDKGLVIIGVTRHYGYDWDDENKRPKRVAKTDDENEPEFTPEDEQAAMLKFAEHHELKHRFMVTPKESTYHKDYGVTGIPQAVLIDREGKIRLIRVGSGEANAEEIGTLLAELIGDGK